MRRDASVALALRCALLAALGVVTFGGCGKFYWTKPGATFEAFERDNTACAREASPNPTAASHGAVDMQAYRACLSSRGWTRQQHAFPTADAYRGFE